MLLDTAGKPMPPQDVLAALARIDDRLGLEYSWEGCWWFVIRWSEDDPRREKIKKGILAPDAEWDIIGRLPFDCPVDEARGYFEQAMRSNASRKDVERMASRVEEWNRKVEAERFEQVDNELTERLVRTSNKRTGHFDFDKAVSEVREEGE